MHYCVHLLTKELPSENQIADIMNPYYVGNVYSNLDEENEDHVVNYPTFTWDCYQIGGKYKAEACCHKDDTYNEEIGLFLASNRLFIKILQDMVNSEIRQMKYDVVDELFRNVAKASAKLGVKFV